MSVIHYLLRVISFLAVCYLASSSAYPTHNNAGWADKGRNKSAIEVRAPDATGSVIIPVYQQAGHNTWTGFQVKPGIFSSTVSDEAVRATARKTYESIAGSLPWDMETALLAVVYVPGGGWAAGTIWHGTETAFQTFAANSPTFRRATQGQRRLPNADNEHEWHAEAVAVAQAEAHFSRQIKDGRWPRGTKIFTYGKTKKDGTGAKSVCVPGRTSVVVSCGEWIDYLDISVVSISG